MTENMQHHVKNKLPFTENTFRYGSESFLDLWAEARYLYSRNAIHVNEDDKHIILETNLGEYGMYNGKKVPLDMIIEDEERGGEEDLQYAKDIRFQPLSDLLGRIMNKYHDTNNKTYLDLYNELQELFTQNPKNKLNYTEILIVLKKYLTDAEANELLASVNAGVNEIKVNKPGDNNYRKVENIAKSMESTHESKPELEDFYKTFPKNQPILFKDYIKWAMLWMDDMSEVEYAKANWDLEVNGIDTFEQRGLFEIKVNKPSPLNQLLSLKSKIEASNDPQEKASLAIQCAERALYVWEEKHPNNNIPRKAIEAAKKCLVNPTEKNKQAAKAAATAAYRVTYALGQGDEVFITYDDYTASDAAAFATYQAALSTVYNDDGSSEYAAKYAIDAVKKYYNLNESKDKNSPPLNKPKRGGSKKFYVYVRNPKTKKIKKVSFGDTTGLSAKLNNPKARKAFAARHDCKNKKDKTKASYWSCHLPRYAKLLGIKSNFSGYW